MPCQHLIRHSVAVAAGIGAGDAVAVRGIDQNRGRAAIDAEGAYPAHVVPTRLQILEYDVRNVRLEIPPFAATGAIPGLRLPAA